MPARPRLLGRGGKGMRGRQADSPEGGGGLAGAVQGPSLLSSLPSLRAAASSQGLSGPGRGLSALSVSPWHPPLWRWQCSGGGWSWVSPWSSRGFPTDTPGIWSWALLPGLVFQGLCCLSAQGPAGVWDGMQHLHRAGQRAWALGARAEAHAGRRGLQPPSHPVSFGCMSLGSGKHGFHPGGSRGSLSAAPGGCQGNGLGVGPWLRD